MSPGAIWPPDAANPYKEGEKPPLQHVYPSSEQMALVNSFKPVKKTAEEWTSAMKELWHAGDYLGALRLASNAIKTGPTSAAALTNRAAIFIKLHQWSAAQRDCQAALQLDKICLQAYARLIEYDATSSSGRSKWHAQPCRMLGWQHKETRTSKQLCLPLLEGTGSRRGVCCASWPVFVRSRLLTSSTDMYIVEITLYIFETAMYIVEITMYIVEITLYIVEIAMYIVEITLFIVETTMYIRPLCI